MNLREIFNDALPIIRDVAPTIAGALGGPVGIAAGAVIPVLANAFGVKSSGIANVAAAILNDPDAKSKLQQAEETHKELLNFLMDGINNLANAEITVKLGWK